MREAKVLFKEEDVKKYLDGMIRSWRSTRDNERNSSTKSEMFHKAEPLLVMDAICHIAAYQAIREALFGEILEENEDP